MTATRVAVPEDSSLLRGASCRALDADPRIADLLLEAPARYQGSLERLTGREREVLAAVATGASNRMIAQRLVVSPRSVEKHINAIFAKLGLTNDADVDRRVTATLIFLAAP